MPAYDVIIIGAGPGGYVAAIRAAQLGLRTAIVERSHLGGICLNWGCIPTKSLLHSAELLDHARQSETFGLEPPAPAVNIAGMVARSRAVAKQLNGGVQFLLRKNKVDVIWGEAELLEPGLVRVCPAGSDSPVGVMAPGDYRAAHVIIATGARDRSLAGISPDGKRVWSYRDAMTAPAVPASLVVLGAGAIGVEFASLYKSLGAQVTLIERLPRILPLEDEEIADLMGKVLRKRGIEIVCGAEVSAVMETPKGISVSIGEADGNTRTVVPERLLSAVGVVPNLEGLGIGRLGVALNGGAVATDGVGRTNVAGLYAIGDAAGPPMLAHKAQHEGIRCVEAIAGVGQHASIAAVPSCIYSDPQMASVGLTEQAALEQGQAVDVGRFNLRGNGKAVTIAATDGMVKLIFARKSGRLLGAHMIGPSVSELIAALSLAVTLGATRDQLVHTIFPHPTLSEAIHEAALASQARAIHA